MALRTLWADTGLPTHLTFDAAQNITAAGTIFGGTEETERSDLLSKKLAGNLGHLMDLRKPVPYAAHRQGLVERNVGLVKKQLKILLAPMGVVNTLSPCLYHASVLVITMSTYLYHESLSIP